MAATLERTFSAPSPAPAVAPLLELRGVVKRWPGAAAPVLGGVELAVCAGEAVAITGRNGTGKTTLLRIAAGMLLADAGSVRVAGLDPERDRTAYHARVGFLSAGDGGLYGRLTVEQHLDFWARLALLPRARRRAATERVRATFALAELCGRRVSRLSMGQRQRVRLALAFLHEPDLVLLDEPRTSLDDEGAQLLAAAVAELTARGGAAVVCAPGATETGIPCDRRHRVDAGALLPT
jgi:ABC-type multidrug transport system ATPase subunit